MAHVARTIEVDQPVETIYEEWTRFEGLPRCAAHSIEAQVRWRAEVLTLQPKGARTQVTLRIDYDPSREDPALPARIETVLESFRSFVAKRAER